MSSRIPPVFISHGAPSLVLEDHPARDFLAGLGEKLGKPKAILCVSAHWETAEPTVSVAERPATIHDFYGFPEELYRMTYPAPGAPGLARQAAQLLKEASYKCREDPARGLDHGAWSPLTLIYPQADIPVTQLSIQPAQGPRHHLAIGRALEPLSEEGVLILASGGAVHNLGQFRIDRRNPAAWAVAFEEWLTERLGAGDAAALARFADTAEGGRAHPTDEHFLPLFVALGAGGEGALGRALYRGFAHGSLAMSAYAMERGG